MSGQALTYEADWAFKTTIKTMKPICLCVLLASVMCVSSIAFATPQETDRICYGGHEYALLQVPMLGLWYYGEGKPPNGKSRPPAFDFTSSANWVGYSASWEIRNKRLLLRTIRGRVKGKDVQNEAILTNVKFPALATWFTGKIHLPVGDYDEEKQEHEAIIVFEIDKGNVKSMTFVLSGKISATWNGL